MLDHHIQRSIVYHLALAHSLRFSELKPDDIENKLFTYHLKKVIAAGYVQKDDDGQYSLTPEGRRLGIRVNETPQDLLDRPDAVLFLVIRRKSDGAWLLYKRNTHPLIDRIGFMHTHPMLELDAPKAAALVCQQRTGITGDFKVMGNGYFRVFDGDELESFTHFTLLTCEYAQGELTPNDEHAGYFWQTNPDFSGDDMLPNMKVLSDLYLKGEPFFVEKHLTV